MSHQPNNFFAGTQVVSLVEVHGTNDSLVRPRGAVGGTNYCSIAAMSHARKLLFVCSQNRLRSLTAEHLYRGFLEYAVKSAGTSPKARIRVNAGHIGWADIIFVMEKKHAQLLSEKFGEAMAVKKVICLRIPDDYRYMEPALIEELKARLRPYVEVPG